MTEKELQKYLLQKFPQENVCCEWKEMKNLKNSFANDAHKDVISYVSAIANMHGGYLVIGVVDKTLDIVGTDLTNVTFNGDPATPQSATFKLIEKCQYLSSEGLKIEEFKVDAAKQVGLKTSYIKNRSFDDEYYMKLIVEYLKRFKFASRKDIEGLILDKLSEVLSLEQKRAKVGNLLTKLRKNDVISPGKGKKWELRKK